MNIPDDPIIDRSPEQARLRLEQLREELLALGYSITPTKTVSQQFWERKLSKKQASG